MFGTIMKKILLSLCYFTLALGVKNEVFDLEKQFEQLFRKHSHFHKQEWHKMYEMAQRASDHFVIRTYHDNTVYFSDLSLTWPVVQNNICWHFVNSLQLSDERIAIIKTNRETKKRDSYAPDDYDKKFSEKLRLLSSDQKDALYAAAIRESYKVLASIQRKVVQNRSKH